MKRMTVTALLDEIQRVLKRDNRSVADLAKDLGRDYHHVYDWVCRRRFDPGPVGLKLLTEWLANPYARAQADLSELETWKRHNPTVESAYYWFCRCKEAEQRLSDISRIARLRP